MNADTKEILTDERQISNKKDKVEVLKPAPRQSGIELLRIVAMFLIVLHHASLFGEVTFESYLAQKVWVALAFGGKIGVNVFVLISAYFMINKDFKLTRVLNLYFEALFYSIVIYILSIIFGMKDFLLKRFYMQFFLSVMGSGGF